MGCNQTLDAPDLSSGNYVDAVDAKRYYVAPSQRERKFRVNNNLVGNGWLSALMKRNESLIGNDELGELARKPLAHHSMELLARATRYQLNDTAELYRHLCFDAYAQYLSPPALPPLVNKVSASWVR